MRRIFSLFLVLAPLYLFSQSEYNIETGPLIPVKFNWITTFFGEDGGNYYFSAKRLNKNQYSLYVFDKDLSLQRSKELKLDYRLVSYGYQGSALFGFIFTSVENGNLVFVRPEFKAKATSGIETLYKESVDKDSFESNSQSAQLSEAMKVLRPSSNKDMGFIMEAESPSKSVRVFSMATANFSIENAEYQIRATDQYFNVLSESTISENMPAEKFYREALGVND
ncbi:MAG: hypothetical protein AAGC47_13010, partial [Bacteroidota bacterium]